MRQDNTPPVVAKCFYVLYIKIGILENIVFLYHLQSEMQWRVSIVPRCVEFTGIRL